MLWLTLVVTVSAAAEAGQQRAEVDAGPVTPSARIAPETSMRAALVVRMGFGLAFERLSELPSCAALFEGLHLGGTEALRRTTYSPARGAARAHCSRGAVAVSRLGRTDVFLCPSILSLTQEGVAAILIHEALHGAGLGEGPVHPLSPGSAEITRTVAEACLLGEPEGPRGRPVPTTAAGGLPEAPTADWVADAGSASRGTPALRPAPAVLEGRPPHEPR